MKDLLKDIAALCVLTVLFLSFITLGLKLSGYDNDPVISPTDKLIMEIKGGGKWAIQERFTAVSAAQWLKQG